MPTPYDFPGGYQLPVDISEASSPEMADETIAANPEGAAGPPAEAATLPPGAAPTPDFASVATHPMAVSKEEGLFAAPQEEVVAQLNRLLRMKYTTILAYTNYGDRLRHVFRDSVAAHFKEHRKEEQADAYHLAMKITALGGEPEPKTSAVVSTAELHLMIVALLDLELELLQALRKLSAMAGENLSLKVMVDEMVLKDQQHADDLRRMLPGTQGAL